MNGTTRLKIEDINKNFICVLCGGYYIDATTIIECLHSFCRTCIVTYLKTSKTCPVCDTIVHKTRPHQNIRSDKLLQDLVYKLVPGLYKDEMRRRREFYTKHYDEAPKRPGEERGDEMSDRFAYTEEEKISLALHFCPDGAAERVDYRRVFTTKEDMKARMDKRIKEAVDVRYLQCKAAVTIGHLKKFVRLKYGLPPHFQVDMFYNDEPLRSSCSLCDIAYFFNWTRRSPLMLTFSVFESTIKQESTVKECPFLNKHTPLKIKQATSALSVTPSTPSITASTYAVATKTDASSVQTALTSTTPLLPAVVTASSSDVYTDIPKPSKLQSLHRTSVKNNKSKSQSESPAISTANVGSSSSTQPQGLIQQSAGISRHGAGSSNILADINKQQPGTTTQLTDSSRQSTGTSKKLVSSTNQLTDSSKQSVVQTSQLTDSSNQSTVPTNHFTDSIMELVVSTNQLTDSSKQSVVSTNQLTDSSSRLAVPTNHLTDSNRQMAGSSKQSSDSTNQLTVSSKRTTGPMNKLTDSSRQLSGSSKRLACSTNQLTDTSRQSSSTNKRSTGQLTDASRQSSGQSKPTPRSKSSSLGKRPATTPVHIAPAPAKIPTLSSSLIDITTLHKQNSQSKTMEHTFSRTPKLVSLLPVDMPQSSLSQVSTMKEPYNPSSTITFSVSSILNAVASRNGISPVSMNRQALSTRGATAELISGSSSCPMLISSPSSPLSVSSRQPLPTRPQNMAPTRLSAIAQNQTCRHLKNSLSSTSSSTSTCSSSFSSSSATDNATQSSSTNSVGSPTPAASASPTPAAVPLQQSQTQGSDIHHLYSTTVSKQIEIDRRVDTNVTQVYQIRQGNISDCTSERYVSCETDMDITDNSSHAESKARVHNSGHRANNGCVREKSETNSPTMSSMDTASRIDPNSHPSLSSPTNMSPHSMPARKDVISSPATSPTSNGSSPSGMMPKQSKQKKIADIANTLHKRMSDALLGMGSKRASSPGNRRPSQSASPGLKSFSIPHTHSDIREISAPTTLIRPDLSAKQSLQNVPPNGQLLTKDVASEFSQNNQSDEPLNLVKRDIEIVRFTNGLFILDIPTSVT